MKRWMGLAVVGVLAGCATTGSSERTSYQLVIGGHPVATVTLESPPIGNVVETHIEGDTAKVSVHYRGDATVEPVAGAKMDVERVRLSEDSLPLVSAVLAGRYEDAQRALSNAGSSSRDDLAREVLLSLTDRAVAAMERTKEGRRLLDRFVNELTDEYLGAEDTRQTHRILAHRAQRIGVESFTRAIQEPKPRIFPVRRSGVTVFNEASPELRWVEGGGFRVKYSTWAYRDGNPGLDFQGEEVREDEIIGVRLYDQGGRVVFGPALMLVQHANQAKQQVVLKMAEMAALGLSAGLSGAVAKVTFLVWCDRVAVVLGLVTSVIDEHRGGILARYGEAGERFLFYSDVVASAVALYGAARVVTAAPKLIRGMRDSYSRFKAVERGALQDVESSTEKLLHELEGAEIISIEDARPPPVIEEPLQATGTDGALIRLGKEGETTVASAGGGRGPKEPLRPAAPSGSRAPRGASGNVVRLAIAARDAEEAEALAAKFAELEIVAPGQRQTTDLAKLERLRPNVSRPPARTDATLPLWQEYAAYWEQRFEGLAAGVTKKGPLEWLDYQRVRNHFLRGLEHERKTAITLLADAQKPVEQRIFLRGIEQPSIESNVGVFKSNELGVRFADHLVVDMRTLKSGKPRGVVLSAKSRSFVGLEGQAAERIARADAMEAVTKYGGRVVVRRRGHLLFGHEMEVEKVYLIYEVEDELVQLVPEKLRRSINAGARQAGVEVLYR